MNNLTTLIAEQNKQVLGIIAANVLINDDTYLEKSIMDWHTASTIKLLEAIICEMEKEIKKADNFVPFQRIHYVDGIQKQINNLTAVIAEMK